jgi:hypothetical protein
MKKNFYLIFVFNNCRENILPEETKTLKGTKNLDDQYTLEEKENLIRDGGEISSSYDEIMKTKLEEYLEEKKKLEFSKITENKNEELQRKNEEEQNKINSEYDKKFQEERKKIYNDFNKKMSEENGVFSQEKKKSDERNEYHRNKIDSLERERDKKINELKINLEKERDEKIEKKIKELKESYQNKLANEIENKKKDVENNSKNSKEKELETFNKKYKPGILSAIISGLERGGDYQNTLEEIIEKYIQQSNLFALE